MGNAIFRLFGNQEVRLVMIGLDSGGKTTLLYRLKLREVNTLTTPSRRAMKTIRPDFQVASFDVGGRCSWRLWFRRQLAGADGLVYVIDASDKIRYNESMDELLGMLSRPQLAPLVILTNKHDLPNAVTPEDVTKFLLLKKPGLTQDRAWRVFAFCALDGDGLPEALDWLTGQIGRRMVREYLTGPIKTGDEKTRTDGTGDSYSFMNMGSSVWSYLTKAVSYLDNRYM